MLNEYQKYRRTFIKTAGLALSAGVCAAHYYDPDKAEFKNFEPFWEFVSGPLNAGSFGPHQLGNTFGPRLIFQKASPNPNLSPLSGPSILRSSRY